MSKKKAASNSICHPRPYALWKNLKKIGEALYKVFTDEELCAIERASQIVAFTNFPIGLAILPTHSAPLCCYKEIAYRHLMPLTSTTITELSGHIVQNMTKGLNVLMFECIKEDDPIRKISDEKLKNPLKQLLAREDCSFTYKEVLSVVDFYNCINQSTNIDILIISAHGFYDDKVSGIYVGDEKLVDIQNINNSPKLVMFSACHVCPRGNKAYSIVEQMIRSGILAVLGTYIPVDVYRNANIFIRFIIAILSTQKGEYLFNNVLEIWEYIVSSNAVYEIKESNKRIKEWLDSCDKMIEFQNKADNTKIRYTDTYTDTIDLLISMADDEQIKLSLSDIKFQKKYFPESIFYEMNGYPEKIVVNKQIEAIFRCLDL